FVAKIPWMACWNLAAFMMLAIMYHIRLAGLRPANRRLSEYYLMIAVGGALGGILNAFVVPLVFDRLAEYPIVPLAACLLHPAFRPRLGRDEKILFGAAAVYAFAVWWLREYEALSQGYVIALILIGVTAYFPRIAIPGGIALLIVAFFADPVFSLH